MRTTIESIHQNPVRRGLVSNAVDWPWSSVRYYEGFDDVAIKREPLPVLEE